MPTQPQIQETGLDGVITEFGLALIAQRGEEWRPVGTAVLIAPHLALTAKHVVDECWRLFGDERKLKFGDLHGEFSLLAQQVLSDRQGVLWVIRRLWCSPHTDLAVLQLQPFSDLANDYRWRSPQLHIQAPTEGAEVWCFGYRGGEAIATTDSHRTSVHWTTSPSTAVGTVVEVHQQRRDLGMLNFPCFRTSAPFTHGMSGGPIFVNGLLSGIICASGLEGSDGERRAYGATLWPILATELELDFQGEPPGSSYTVHKLAKRGFIRVVDLDTVLVSEYENGKQLFQSMGG